MVKSEPLFCRLIGIDTLLSFDGIIPSVEDFQLKLTTLIEQLNKALLAENQAPEESEALCRALCCYFDKRLTGEPQNSALSWQRYSLVHYFYGHTESASDLDLTTQLDALLRSDSEAIFRYAWKLLIVLIHLDGQTEALVALRSASRSRYLALTRPPQARPESWLTPSDAPAGSPRLMIFIIGPFAGKWFSQSDLSSSNNSDIVWVVVEHATSLAKRLAYLHKNYSGMSTLAFFPLLADGVESNSLMIEQITAWQYAFSSTHLPERLPCMLGIYTRLSLERYPHDPDRAIWTGGLTTAHAHLKLESRLVELVDELDVSDANSDLFAIQRHALGSTLVAWLAENRIMSTLQNLFDHSQLNLTGVTLADHGPGFTRHGAWSVWLAEKYGILPGLSTAIAMPPLPVIGLPPRAEVEVERAPHSIPVPPVAPAPARRRRIWPIVAALLLALAGGLWIYHDPQATPGWHPTSETAAIAPSLFALSETAPMFKRGSSDLLPESEKTLQAMIPDMQRLPQQTYLIVGHSDSTGTAAINLALSTERARVIRDWLVLHSGLPASQFIIEGAGNTRPIASNETQEGRALNRRVEIIPLSTQGNKD